MYKRNKAYSLVELSISLSVLAIIFTGLLSVYFKKDETRRYKITLERMAVIQKAIADFADTNFYLPCPVLTANSNSLESSIGFGRYYAYGATLTPSCPATSGVSATDYIGMVPVRDLNLPDFYAYDGWERKFSYSIATGMGSANDVATGIYRGDIKIIDLSGSAKTLLNRDYSYNDGAAYVLISYGSGGNGAWLKNSTASPVLPSSSSREYYNANYTPYKKFIQADRNYLFNQILVYRTLPDLINIKYKRSPIRIPLSTCTNANAVLNDPNYDPSKAIRYSNIVFNSSFSATGTTAPLIISETASAVAKLCLNQPRKLFLSGSSCEFNPSQIANLQFWIDASDINNGGSQPTNGTSVTSWLDKSGNSRNSTASSSSTYQSQSPFAKGAIYSTVSDSDLGQAFKFPGTFLLNSDNTIFAVYSISPSIYNSNSKYAILDTMNNAVLLTRASGSYSFGIATATDIALHSYTSILSNIINEQPLPFLNTTNSNKLVLHLPYLTYKVSNSSVPSTILYTRTPNGYVSQNYNNTAPLINTGGDLLLSNNGYIAEIIIYSGALTSYQLKKVEGYLLRKWFSGEC